MLRFVSKVNEAITPVRLANLLCRSRELDPFLLPRIPFPSDRSIVTRKRNDSLAVPFSNRVHSARVIVSGYDAFEGRKIVEWQTRYANDLYIYIMLRVVRRYFYTYRDSDIFLLPISNDLRDKLRNLGTRLAVCCFSRTRCIDAFRVVYVERNARTFRWKIGGRETRDIILP